MSVIIHVNKFVLQGNRENNRNDPPYCIHGPEDDGFPYLGRYHAVRGEGPFTFAPGRDLPIPEPDTPAGATHVMVLDGEECDLWGDDGERWVKVRLEPEPPRAAMRHAHQHFHHYHNVSTNAYRMGVNHRHEHHHPATMTIAEHTDEIHELHRKEDPQWHLTT